MTKSATPTPTPRRRRVSAPQAQKLFADLKSGLLGVLELHKTFQRIRETRAWKALGYDTFKDACDGLELSHIIALLPPEFINQLVFDLDDEGYSSDEIADTLPKISPRSVDNLKRDKAYGVDPEVASRRPTGRQPIVVTEHIRSKPKPPMIIRLEVPADEYREYARIARKQGIPVNTIAERVALPVIAARFSDLAAINDEHGAA
jgi:hypothetical protein